MSSAASDDVELAHELDMLRDTVRRFVAEEIVPAEARLQSGEAKLDADKQAALQNRARELGLWALATPEPFGGATNGGAPVSRGGSTIVQC